MTALAIDGTTPANAELVIPVLAVATEGELPPTAELASVAPWFDAVTDGRFLPRLAPPSVVTLGRRATWYCGGGARTGDGGLGPGPRNGQALVAEALAGLGNDRRRALHGCGDVVLVIAPAPLRPHAWRLRGGGVSLGGGRWCRRYALVPDGAPVGVLAHELAHLLLGWPDLGHASGLGDWCLMANGGLRGGGRNPAPPCSALLLRSGLKDPLIAERSTRVRDVAGGAVARLVLGDTAISIERRASADDARLLVCADSVAAGPGDPGVRLLDRPIPLDAADEERPLLAVIQPALRALRAARAGAGPS